MSVRAAPGLALLVALLLAGGRARAQACEAGRPTDPGGTNGVAYGEGVEVISGDSASGRARIFFASGGPHAPTSMAAVEAAREAADLALASYEAMGYLPVVSDADSPCASNGGGAEVDIYLVNFSAADGQTVADHCEVAAGVRRCSGFILVENDFKQGGYVDAVEGMRTVVPHEIFHLVQNAYGAGIDRFWAEGSAEWAAKRVYPELVDLERFLPTYFENPARPLDASAGVASNFLYATGIWPVYLSQQLGDDLIRRIFVKIAGGQTALAATADELAASGTSLEAEFLRFAAFNAATGSRAREGSGYADAATYPEVPVTDFDAEPGSVITGVGSGLGAAYFSLRVAGARKLTMAADPTRVAASFLPFDGDALDLDSRKEVPAVIDGDGVLVVAGQSNAKTDAPFRVTIAENGGSELEKSSCSVARVRPGSSAGLTLAGALLGAAALRRRRTRR